MIPRSHRSATFMMSTLPPKTGGEIYDHYLYRHAQGQGWQIDYVTVQEHREATQARLSSLPSLLRSLLTPVVLARRLGSRPGLVVQDQEYSFSLLVTNLLHLLFRRGPIITVVHHLAGYESTAPASGQWLQRWKHRLALGPSARLVTVSEYSRRELLSLGLDPGRIVILPPGADRSGLEIFPRQPAGDAVHIIALGTVSPRKGTIHLVEAFLKLARPNAHLHIVGSTTVEAPYFAEVKSLLARRGGGIADRVHFHGRLEQSEVNQLLSQADIFTMPSLQEGFGIALLEGMHYGLPIITTNISAQPELVEEGVNGLLVPPGDVPALAAALLRLVDDAELRRALGERGRQRLEGRYLWETTCRDFEKIMIDLTSGPTAAAA